MSKSWLVRLGLVTSVAATLIFGTAAGAGASITVGQVAPSPASLQFCGTGPFDEAQKQITSGASYTVPTAGVLTSWSTLSAVGGKLGLKVYRPVAGGFQVVAVDGPQTLALNSLNTFPVSIPVQPGDLVGITWPAGANSNCLFVPGNAGDVIMWSSGNQPTGGIASLGSTETNRRVNISANLLPPPLVTSISPAGGSIAGGTSVTITGSNFANVSSVTFGGVPATSYTVDSENQITAVTPPSKLPGTVLVTVTTVAGLAHNVQAYAYTACTVPKLKTKSLKAAKKAIKKAGCKVGKLTKVNGATGKTGKVSKQNPKPGSHVVTGTKVKVTLKPPN